MYSHNNLIFDVNVFRYNNHDLSDCAVEWMNVRRTKSAKKLIYIPFRAR